MNIVAFVIGMGIPTLIGWLLVRLTEQDTPVLSVYERWVVAFALGITATMFAFFVGEESGFMQFTAANFLLLATVLLIGLGTWYMRVRIHWPKNTVQLVKNTPLSRKKKIILFALGSWTILKICNAAFLLIASPPYLDDVFNNWNMRGKMYYVTQELELTMEIGNDITSDAGVSSYPPTVPLVKTWLATLAGNWNEGLINAPHILWYISVLLLVFFFLRRQTTFFWACIGTYGLSSLPIFTLHAAHAYADVFVAMHVFFVVSCLYSSIATDNDAASVTWLRLAGLGAALLVFTKNEALLLHLPACILLFIVCIYALQKQGVLSRREIQSTVVHNSIALACVLVPWLLFKWAHDLPFGNAKSVSGMDIAWQAGAAKAIWINTFFEGNWILLFPILIGLIVTRWRSAFFSICCIFTAYVLMLLLAQIPLYLFTGLSTEAIKQTGLARGFVQLAPEMVTLVILLYTYKPELDKPTE